MSRELLDIDLDNIEGAARSRGFAHPNDTLLLVAEVRRLRLELEGQKKAYALMEKGMERVCEINDGLKQESRRLCKEIERLKSGDLTEEEFQGLCHNLSADDEARFKQGCVEYQRKLFGCKGDAT